MNPNYLPQTLVYFLALPPPAAWTASSPLPPSAFAPGRGGGCAAAGGDGGTAAAASLGCSLAAAALLAVAATRTEWWPLSSIPMYSFYRGAATTTGRRGKAQAGAGAAEDGGGAAGAGWAGPEPFSPDCVASPAQLAALAREAASAGYPYALGWGGGWVAASLVGPAADGAPFPPLDALALLRAALPPLGLLCVPKALTRAVVGAAARELVARSRASAAATSAAVAAAAASPPPPPPAAPPSPAAALLRGVLRPLVDAVAAAGGPASGVPRGASLRLVLRMAGGREVLLAQE